MVFWLKRVVSLFERLKQGNYKMELVVRDKDGNVKEEKVITVKDNKVVKEETLGGVL